MRQKSKIKTTPLKITLTDDEMLFLSNIRRAGSFRSDSHTIGETLRLVQSLRDVPEALRVLGPRFGIVVEESK